MATTPETSMTGLVASIQVRCQDDSIAVHRMQDGTSLIAGQDENCGLKLDDPAVADRHCVFRMADGQLHVNDWYSESGTFVNGEKIYAETKLNERDQVTLGPFELRFDITSARQVNDANFDQPRPASTAAASPVEPANPEPVVNRQADGDFSVPASQPEATPRETVDDLPAESPERDDSAKLRRELARANSEIESLSQELEYQLTLQTSSEKAQAEAALDPMQADEADLMRSEIEHLQRELEIREQEIQELACGTPADEPVIDSTETARLVERLEQLLEELAESDRRAKSLESLLQAADEANHAEREERQQLELWVSEIENRILAREQEWLAGEESLKQQLAEAEDRSRQSEKNLRLAARGDSEEFRRVSRSRIEDLTDQNARLSEELEKIRGELDRVNRLFEQTGETESDRQSLAGKLEQVRQSEVEMAQERASLARQRTELARLREELESSQRTARTMDEDNPDVKVRAFRQHLKEIHEQEQHQRQQSRGLASRISRLWNRLEDR